ncbi:MAG: class I SAM-dependent rRNA methyltransferase [Alphaproteobacteria bacterium]|nr:class I SAM-dependent rRNA methyltransferase [Alphaproteobacteria bacterium]
MTAPAKSQSPAVAAPRPIVRLRPGRQGRVLHGHPWVYSNEIEMDPATKALASGSIVRLERHNGGPIGTAMFHPHTLIAARMLSREPTDQVDVAFLRDRVERALALRTRILAQPYYRLIHAEADGLPGLVVDRYGDVLALQANTAGIDRLLPMLLPVLQETLRPSAIALRNDSPARAVEGLDQDSRWTGGTHEGSVRVEEGGATFFADVLAGQKTGWFYDQRDNRDFIASLSSGARVLDAYTHTGGFAVRCARSGASAVVAIDRSESALALAARAATESGVAGRITFRRAEVFAELEALAAAKERFDVVIADPPAFVKSRRELESGQRGYRKLARLSVALTAPRGILGIASCSHNVSVEAFQEQVARGLADAGRTGRIIRSAGAAADHPLHPMLPESVYLKMLVLALD